MTYNGSAAAAEFQKFLDHRGIVLNFPLGRWPISAWPVPARSPVTPPRPTPPTKDFLTLWKEADPDIPILKQAKAEYTKRVLSSE